MSDPNPHSQTVTTELRPVGRRRSPLRRIGCAAGLILWALVMITPCGLFLLITQQQIVIPLGTAPDQVLRIWLVSEPRERGLGVSWASLHAGQSDQSVCVQTNIRFLLWAGQGEGTTYCDCFQRMSDDDPWASYSSQTGSCPP